MIFLLAALLWAALLFLPKPRRWVTIRNVRWYYDGDYRAHHSPRTGGTP